MRCLEKNAGQRIRLGTVHHSQPAERAPGGSVATALNHTKGGRPEALFVQEVAARTAVPEALDHRHRASLALLDPVRPARCARRRRAARGHYRPTTARHSVVPRQSVAHVRLGPLESDGLCQGHSLSRVFLTGRRRRVVADAALMSPGKGRGGCGHDAATGDPRLRGRRGRVTPCSGGGTGSRARPLDSRAA
jgi:hypothetical protein